MVKRRIWHGFCLIFHRMFTSDKKLKLRGGSREERLAYMRKLIAEFHSSWLLGKPKFWLHYSRNDWNFTDVKRQIAANLANFAYDPFNYENLKIVGVVDVFLACLTSKDSELMRISSAGLFNLSSGEFSLFLFFSWFLTSILFRQLICQTNLWCLHCSATWMPKQVKIFSISLFGVFLLQFSSFQSRWRSFDLSRVNFALPTTYTVWNIHSCPLENRQNIIRSQV